MRGASPIPRMGGIVADGRLKLIKIGGSDMKARSLAQWPGVVLCVFAGATFAQRTTPVPSVPPPPGPYLQTCSKVKTTAEVLSAMCSGGTAAVIMPTILKLPCAGSIENINCKLHCIKPAPKGRYLDTC